MYWNSRIIEKQNCNKKNKEDNIEKRIQNKKRKMKESIDCRVLLSLSREAVISECVLALHSMSFKNLSGVITFLD